jgi:hypothetical protein
MPVPTIPTPPGSPTAAPARAVRQCPTLSGNSQALITHRIEVGQCMKRQREFYHKCHRCQYRGQAADFVAEERIELSPTAETGVPKEHFELPAPDRDPS